LKKTKKCLKLWAGIGSGMAGFTSVYDLHARTEKMRKKNCGKKYEASGLAWLASLLFMI
jgi:hypothetical protein